jgi:hypothetical protein
MIVIAAVVRVLGWMVRRWRIMRRFFIRRWIFRWILRRIFRGVRAGILIPWRAVVVLVVVVALAITGIHCVGVSDSGAAYPRVAAGKLRFAFVAHLVQSKLLLFFEVAADVGILAIGLAASSQLVVLATVQAVDLVVQINSQFFTRVWQFGLARFESYGRGQKEGPDYKGVTYPLTGHRNILLSTLLFGSGRDKFVAFDL